MFGISQSTISKKIPFITKAIASLAADKIKFPTSDQGLETSKFFVIYGNFPGVVAVIDGVHWIETGFPVSDITCNIRFTGCNRL